MTDRFDVRNVEEFLASLPPVTEEQRSKNLAEQAEWEAKYGHLNPMDAMHKMTEDGLNEQFGLEGWTYRDVPWTTEKAWNKLLAVVDPEEIKIITLTTNHNQGTVLRRGTMLVSPRGMENMNVFNSKSKEEKEAYFEST